MDPTFPSGIDWDFYLLGINWDCICLSDDHKIEHCGDKELVACLCPVLDRLLCVFNEVQFILHFS